MWVWKACCCPIGEYGAKKDGGLMMFLVIVSCVCFHFKEGIVLRESLAVSDMYVSIITEDLLRQNLLHEKRVSFHKRSRP
jgi:hypothetical protein